MVNARLLSVVLLGCILFGQGVAAQEVLLPLQRVQPQVRHASKGGLGSVELPFFDDFASGGLSPTLWQAGGGATTTLDVSPIAPTVGVAMLDALAADGRLHPLASSSLFPADTLTSLPIRLQDYAPADSLRLLFYYLPGGGTGEAYLRAGDHPDPSDSLLLDFYRAADSSWVTVWRRGGTTPDSLYASTSSYWQRVELVLTDPAWFDSLFAFRFRNYASLDAAPKSGMQGNCDWWYIDYVWLDRSSAQTLHDVAFAAPAPSMLRHYRAMPWRQYTPSDLAEQLSISLRNLYSSDLATHYGYRVLASGGAELYSYDGGFENAPADALQTATAHAHPPASLGVDAFDAPTTLTIMHTLREGTTGDSHPLNDTLHHSQIFADYYAYDDGTPENGYGLSAPFSTASLAYRFDLHQPDTLTAIDLFFNATLDCVNEQVPFYLCLWENANGKPGKELYRDPQRLYPVAGDFHRYVLQDEVVVQGSFFVGFEQQGTQYINLGFDRSLNTSDRIFYLTSSAWQQSILGGSLMMRPCFGAGATVGIEHEDPAALEVRAYPNPTTGLLQIQIPASSEPPLTALYDMQGQCCYAGRTTLLHLEALPAGVYILHVSTEHQRTALKIIKK